MVSQFVIPLKLCYLKEFRLVFKIIKYNYSNDFKIQNKTNYSPSCHSAKNLFGNLVMLVFR
jgi:hypothetical protein